MGDLFPEFAFRGCSVGPDFGVRWAEVILRADFGHLFVLGPVIKGVSGAEVIWGS